MLILYEYPLYRIIAFLNEHGTEIDNFSFKDKSCTLILRLSCQIPDPALSQKDTAYSNGTGK